MFKEKKDELKKLGSEIIEIVNNLSVLNEIRVRGNRGDHYTPESLNSLKSAIKNGGEKGKIPLGFVEDIGKYLVNNKDKIELQKIVDKYKEAYDAVYGPVAALEGYFSPSLKKVRDIYDSVSDNKIISIEDYCRISADDDCYYPLISIGLFLSLLHDRKIKTDHNLDFAYPLVYLIKSQSQYFKNILESVHHGDLLPLSIRESEVRETVDLISKNKTVIESINSVLQPVPDYQGDVFRWSFRMRKQAIQIDVSYCYSIERSFIFVSE